MSNKDRKEKADKLGSGSLARTAKAVLNREDYLERMANNPYAPTEHIEKKKLKTSK